MSHLVVEEDGEADLRYDPNQPFKAILVFSVALLFALFLMTMMIFLQLPSSSEDR